MDKIEFGYNNLFRGYKSVKTADFTEANIDTYLLLDNDVQLFKRNDGAFLYQNLQNGNCYISSNIQYSYRLDEITNTVEIKF